jgi:hypothetical protein
MPFSRIQIYVPQFEQNTVLNREMCREHLRARQSYRCDWLRILFIQWGWRKQQGKRLEGHMSYATARRKGTNSEIN